jgi:predicted transcriptional regulator
MLRCMRTTVRLDDHLLAEAKKQAAETGKTLTAVLEQALRESLARRSGPKATPKSIRLKTAKGSGVRASVDLDNSASLLELIGS